MQLGWSDQWGNILGGADLTRPLEGKEVYGFTTPLITTSSGGKMGKTADGAMWLNADKSLGKDYFLSSYDYWQFWRNSDDADVGRFLRLFTDLPLDEITKLEALEGAKINAAKVRLANEATSMLHGKQAAKDAQETAEKTFADGGAAAGLPTYEITLGAMLKLLAVDGAILTELCASKGEAKRHIKAGALKINGVSISDIAHQLTQSDVNDDGVIKVSIGKKKHALIKPI